MTGIQVSKTKAIKGDNKVKIQIRSPDSRLKIPIRAKVAKAAKSHDGKKARRNAAPSFFYDCYKPRALRASRVFVFSFGCSIDDRLR